MALLRASGGTRVAMKTVRRRDKGVMVDMQFARRRQSGAWITFWQAYKPLTLSATSAYGSFTSGSTRPPALANVSGASDLTIAGGSEGGTITISASLLSGASMSVATGESQVTFSAVVTRGSATSAVYRITVTDGISIATADVSVLLEYPGK